MAEPRDAVARAGSDAGLVQLEVREPICAASAAEYVPIAPAAYDIVTISSGQIVDAVTSFKVIVPAGPIQAVGSGIANYPVCECAAGNPFKTEELVVLSVTAIADPFKHLDRHRR